MAQNNYYNFPHVGGQYSGTEYYDQSAMAQNYTAPVATSYTAASETPLVYDQNYAVDCADGSITGNYGYPQNVQVQDKQLYQTNAYHQQPGAVGYPADANQYHTGNPPAMYNYNASSSSYPSSYNSVETNYDPSALYNQPQQPNIAHHDYPVPSSQQMYHEIQPSITQPMTTTTTTKKGRGSKPRGTRGSQNNLGKGGGKKKSSKPLTAYARFFQEIQHQVREQNPEAQFGDISKLIAARWEQLSQEEKDSYKKRAHEERNQCFLQAALEKANSVATAPEEENGNKQVIKEQLQNQLQERLIQSNNQVNNQQQPSLVDLDNSNWTN